MNNYSLNRSGRKTIAIHVKSDGSVEVRAPHWAKQEAIDAFVRKKEEWIRGTQEKMTIRKAEQRVIALSPRQVLAAKQEAKAYLNERCAHFAPRMGVQYKGVKVNSARARWGSCTSAGSLNFTYRLIFAEPELIDYVVVHELAHRREMNHSPQFWEVVEQILPDYRQRRKALGEFQRQITIVEGD